MGIGEDIKQSSFKSEHQKALINLLYTYNWIMGHEKEHMEVYDLSPQQYNVMRILNGSHPTPLSTQEIRNRMLDKASDASRIVDRLIAKGWVSKCPNAADRRLVDVSINNEGRAIVKKMMTEEDQHIVDLLGHLSDEEAETINTLLDKLRKSGE